MSAFQDAQIAYDMMQDSEYSKKDYVNRVLEGLDDIEVLERAVCDNIDFEELRLHLNNPDLDARNNLIGAMVTEAVDKFVECEIQRVSEKIGESIDLHPHIELEDVF